MIAVMLVTFTMGFKMAVHYPNMVTCEHEAKLMMQDRENIVSATCREEKPLPTVKNYIPPKP